MWHRSTIDTVLGKQLLELYPNGSLRDESCKITVRIQKTQKQIRSLYRFYAAAFATALCYGYMTEDIEKMGFVED